MESKNRNVWIVVIVVLVIACCCVLALAAGGAVWYGIRDVEIGAGLFDLGDRYQARMEESFDLGGAPSLEITNFAGAVTIRPGEGDMVRVVATKKSSNRSRLDLIDVDMSAGEDRLVIKTRKLFTEGNAFVELEITAPAGSRVNVDTGAGKVDVRDITGQIDIHSGAGAVAVRGARGTVRVDLGAGQITYEGAPSGDCRFQTGAGEIILRLPEDPNVRVELGTGMGAVDTDFYVEGRVSPRNVNGVIGDGRQGSIFAQTGVGAVSLRHR